MKADLAAFRSISGNGTKSSTRTKISWKNKKEKPQNRKTNKTPTN